MDLFRLHGSKLSDPPSNAATVTPSDSTDLEYVTRCINVSEPGNVAVITAAGDEVTYFVAAGIQFSVRARRIKSSGTSAGTIVAGW